MRGIKKWEIGLVTVVVLVLTVGFLYGSATYRFDVPKGLTVGDILYANRTDRMTNLTAVAVGQNLASAGVVTAPAYQDANVFQTGTVTLGTTSIGTLSTEQARYSYIIVTNASAAAVLNAPHTAGKLYHVLNSSGQQVTVKKSGGTGIAVANGKVATLIHNGTDYVRVTADQTP